jgi:hypothetical protein
LVVELVDTVMEAIQLTASSVQAAVQVAAAE